MKECDILGIKKLTLLDIFRGSGPRNLPWSTPLNQDVRCFGRDVQIIAESRASELDDQLRRAKTQLDDQSRQLQDANALKARLGEENLELHRHLQDLDTGNAALSKTKTALQQELEETKMKLDEETRVILTAISPPFKLKRLKLICTGNCCFENS